MPLRSHDWFLRDGQAGFKSRSRMKNQGTPQQMFDGRPVIGICNTWSELTPCNANLRILCEHVKRGVLEAGGFPLEFPVMSLGEPLMRPTTMLYRNLASMDVEESIRANPLDGVVLLVGCDKTTPAAIMGACSVDVPTIVVTSGPMLNGKFQGRDIGAGTDKWRFTDDWRTGKMSTAEYIESETCMSRSDGHCMTMGTASSMACVVEALGLMLPGGAAIPAPDARRRRLCHFSGNRIVEMAKEELRPSKILTRDAFENAIKINAAIGGSTNVILHLLAIARRIGVDLCLDDFDELGSQVPLLVNLKPAGDFLMEEFYYAGGLPVVMQKAANLLAMDAITVTGESHARNTAGAVCFDETVISGLDAPFQQEAGIAVLRGNLCPDGAVIKPSAATPKLMRHRGPAVVFKSLDDFHARIDDPDLDVDEDCVLVMQNVGPKGFPGMPEVGNMSLPRKLLDKGVGDMLRISDGRMSGTAYGTVVLHIAPESAIGGALALVRDGDMIELDVSQRRLHLDISEDELERRRARWQPCAAHSPRGYTRLFTDHVQQADLGVDFDILAGGSGHEVIHNAEAQAEGKVGAT
ncbi:MAG: dihydroxy-acid dehydratase [Chloroflexi bacterium]|nr:dihydroxy-acid dehydratase [Chloroflexota bacterium]